MPKLWIKSFTSLRRATLPSYGWFSLHWKARHSGAGVSPACLCGSPIVAPEKNIPTVLALKTINIVCKKKWHNLGTDKERFPGLWGPSREGRQATPTLGPGRKCPRRPAGALGHSQHKGLGVGRSLPASGNQSKEVWCHGTVSCPLCGKPSWVQAPVTMGQYIIINRKNSIGHGNQ